MTTRTNSACSGLHTIRSDSVHSGHGSRRRRDSTIDSHTASTRTRPQASDSGEEPRGCIVAADEAVTICQRGAGIPCGFAAWQKYIQVAPAMTNPPTPSSIIPQGDLSCDKVPRVGGGDVFTGPHVVPTTVVMMPVLALTCRTRQLFCVFDCMHVESENR